MLHCQFEDKMFIPVNIPLLIIQEGTTHREDVTPVCILEDHGIDYIGQCTFVVTFIHQKDDGWLLRGGCDDLDSEVYLFIESCQLEAGSASCNLSKSHHGLVSVDAIHSCTRQGSAMLVPVHVWNTIFVWYVPTLAYLWYLVQLAIHPIVWPAQ